MTQSNQIKNISTLFDQWASSDRATQMANGHAHLMQALLEEIGPQSHERSLLDLGCGTGNFLALAKQAGFRKRFGVDASPKMVQTTQSADPGAQVEAAAFEALPFKDQQFDQITTIEALYYCPKPELALQEIHRVLAPGGRFDMIIDYYAESEGTATWPDGLGFQITRLAIADWLKLAESANLQTCRSRRIIHPDAAHKATDWTSSVWYPTQASYQNYLDNGAFWLTAWRSD